MKNKFTLFSLLFVVAGILAIASFVVLNGTAQTAQNKDKKEVRNIQKEKEISEPTVIQEGVMTAKQKKHSKIFKGYKNKAKIKDLIKQRGNVDIHYPIGDIALPEFFSLNNYFQALFCEADAVVIGTIKSKASQINEDGTFTFTDYELNTEEVLKNNTVAPITITNNITVTRTGGAVKLNGNTVRAMDDRQIPLITEQHYLLFLKFLPDTGGYSGLGSSRNDDSFQLLGNQLIQQVSRNPLPLGAGRKVQANEFMSEIRSAAGATCTDQGGVK